MQQELGRRRSIPTAELPIELTYTADCDSSSEESEIADIINPIADSTIYPAAEGVAMNQNNGNQMMQQWIKQENFTGEKGTIGVDDFLDTMEITLMGIERHIPEGRREQAKVLSLQSHLEGKAKTFWMSLRAESKATYVLAT